MIGIYNITSPSGKIYVGQSINLEKRFGEYFKIANCIEQVRLYRSLEKYGSSNHIFEIIEECKTQDLNRRERYWQDSYSVLGERGLNCRLTETEDISGKLSESTKLKISKALKGRVLTEEHKQKLSISCRGKVHSEETKKKRIASNTGKTRSDETRAKMSLAKRNMSEETKRKMSESRLGKTYKKKQK